MLGQDVFLYNFQTKFSAPTPGLVVAANEENFFEVAAFFPKASKYPGSVVFTNVRIAKTAAEALDLFAKGERYVAGPRNGSDPVPFNVDDVAEKVAPKKK